MAVELTAFYNPLTWEGKKNLLFLSKSHIMTYPIKLRPYIVLKIQL